MLDERKIPEIQLSADKTKRELDLIRAEANKPYPAPIRRAIDARITDLTKRHERYQSEANRRKNVEKKLARIH